MNGVYIRQMPPDALARRVTPFLIRAGLISDNPDPATRRYVEQATVLEQERMKRLDEAPALFDFFFGDLPDYQQKSVDRRLRREGMAVAAFLRDLASALADLPEAAWTDEAIEATARAVGARHGREKGDLTHPVRVAVSGREIGPGLFEILRVLGKERTLRRLAHATDLASSDPLP
jgi:glutamyl-tRNA synthetase